MHYRTLPAAVLLAVPSVAWTATAVMALDGGPSVSIVGVALALASTLTLAGLLVWARQRLAVELDTLRRDFRHELGLHDQHMVNSASALVRSMTALEQALDHRPHLNGRAAVTAEHPIIDGLDSETVEIGRRLSRRLHATD